MVSSGVGVPRPSHGIITMSDKVYVSRAGLQKMKDDLVEFNEERLRIADTIEKAREMGDLAENAEYHAAKEAQAMLHARLRMLEHNVASAAVIEDQDIDTSKAYVGAKVRVLNHSTKKEANYVLVSPVETDLAAGKISTKSPVGQALLGKSVGETVVAKVPAGDLKLEILDITW